MYFNYILIDKFYVKTSRASKKKYHKTQHFKFWVQFSSAQFLQQDRRTGSPVKNNLSLTYGTARVYPTYIWQKTGGLVMHMVFNNSGRSYFRGERFALSNISQIYTVQSIMALRFDFNLQSWAISLAEPELTLKP